MESLFESGYTRSLVHVPMSNLVTTKLIHLRGVIILRNKIIETV